MEEEDLYEEPPDESVYEEPPQVGCSINTNGVIEHPA